MVGWTVLRQWLALRAGRDIRHGFNCQTATALQTCVIAPIICGAGAPSSFAFPPPCERACGTPGARCTLGPDAMRSSAIVSASGLSEAPSDCPTFRLRCFFGCLHFAMANGPITKINVPGRRDRVAAKHLAERVLTWSSVTLSRGSFHPKAKRLLASGSAGADPSCPKTDVTPKPRDAASPASTASHPANVTIAIAPLGGAGRRGI
ncbi:hypothetical protein SAMN05216367_3464 [Tardiphaga sp. OK245]|nr:hypothetical protein SAMN05216367_3464 [Tardiphaga sp. OK245]